MQDFKNFQLQTPSGEKFDCLEYKKDSKLLLIFYKGVWCNFCKKQLIDINNNFKKIKKMNVKIVAVSGDSQMNTAVLSSFIQAKFPLLSDAEGKVLKAYGVGETDKVSPTIFLFDEKEKNIFSWVAENDEDRISAEEILENL